MASLRIQTTFEFLQQTAQLHNVKTCTWLLVGSAAERNSWCFGRRTGKCSPWEPTQFGVIVSSGTGQAIVLACLTKDKSCPDYFKLAYCWVLEPPPNKILSWIRESNKRWKLVPPACTLQVRILCQIYYLLMAKEKCNCTLVFFSLICGMKHWCLSCCHAVVFQQTNKILHSTIPWSICSGHACLLLYAFFILPYLTCQSNHLLIFFGICCNAPRWYSSALLLDLSTSWSLSCRSYLQGLIGSMPL
jgi:hypothetical protein